MRTVHKYPIEDITDPLVVKMPQGAEALSFQTQHEIACIWALVDTEAPTEEHMFRVLATGQPMMYGAYGKYIGTALLREGYFVFHLFEGA